MNHISALFRQFQLDAFVQPKLAAFFQFSGCLQNVSFFNASFVKVFALHCATFVDLDGRWSFHSFYPKIRCTFVRG